jgi:hypothetical protein
MNVKEKNKYFKNKKYSENNDQDNENDQDDENDQDNENDQNHENYVIKATMCSRLSREFGLEEIKIDKITHYDTPKNHGLENSDLIIPNYYNLHKYPSKIVTFDFYDVIKDDIRNCRKLNKYQLEYISNINEEHKYELILVFNECVGNFIELLND